ncbi:MAG: hypothetical protein ABIJ59_02670, partial [Pseudomonadota bacterium]
IFFGSAINLPTFYVKTGTKNFFLKKIVSKISKTRMSRRYPGYTRVKVVDYKKALIQLIIQDGQDLIQVLNMQDILSDLEARINDPVLYSTSGKLVNKILDGQKSQDPMKMGSNAFNQKAEKYYIHDLRKQQMDQGFKVLTEEFAKMDLWAGYRDPALREVINTILNGKDLISFLAGVKHSCLDETMPHELSKQLIFLMILYTNKETKNFERP